ncbi:DNA topoisomerase III [Bacillaceae bacterium IKA-2]|nr:DNA topoisomerase III [Bacillaceae bacterium IKA-2]
MKKVILCEKPSVGRDIARVLNLTKKGNGFLEGNEYIVTWALGHLVTLADPETYDEKYKAWKLEDLPMLPGELKLVVIQKTSKQFQAVKTQLNRKDVGEIIIATDAGREGELVARWIIEKAHVRKPLQRLWISSVTDKAIKEGFKNLKSAKQYENLYYSAVARSEADWYVGLNATRALTTKYNAQLSCGRVQTPTIAIIAKREQEIKKFQPKQFYGISAETDTKLKLVWQDQSSSDLKTFDKVKSDEIIKKLKSQQSAQVTEVVKTAKKSFAPQLYDLTELQRDANKAFGYSPKETLQIMQKLYEQHKILTYPRTDSRFISTDIVETLKERLKACGIGPYAKNAAKLLRSPIKANKSFVDDSKVSDHHAILPTEEFVNLAKLTDKERKIYDFVIKRFLAVISPPFLYEQTKLKAKIGTEVFIASGKIVQSLGWKEIYENRFEEDEEADLKDQQLPQMTKGDLLIISAIKQTSGETKPPAQFNEATLLSAMENPAKYVTMNDKELARTLGKTGGLGTVATRADIIEKLQNTFLLEKRGKDIFVTSKGKQLLELAPEDLKSPALTAEWETKLEAISKGKLNKTVFIQEMKSYAKLIVQEIKNSKEKFKHDNMTGSKCPECGKMMLEVNGKRGKMHVCQDRECGHKKTISQTTNARCPNCKKKLELRGQGEGQIFVCKCGHREKLSTFTERKNRDKHKKVSKGEVSQYLKQQNQGKEEPFNNPFAEALSKLKK